MLFENWESKKGEYMDISMEMAKELGECKKCGEYLVYCGGCPYCDTPIIRFEA